MNNKVFIIKNGTDKRIKVIIVTREIIKYFINSLENKNLYVYDCIFKENESDKEGRRNR